MASDAGEEGPGPREDATVRDPEALGNGATGVKSGESLVAAPLDLGGALSRWQDGGRVVGAKGEVHVPGRGACEGRPHGGGGAHRGHVANREAHGGCGAEERKVDGEGAYGVFERNEQRPLAEAGGDPAADGSGGDPDSGGEP